MPQGGVLVATSEKDGGAKGLSRGFKNGWTNWAAAPVGSEFLDGLVSDGRTIWAGGPEGLGRLRAGKWEHYFADTAITALAAGYGSTVWVGTSGSGVLRVLRGGEKIERFGASQGCETDVVRGMVAVDKTLLVIGEGPAGPRAAYFDGERFYSYALSSPAVLQWAERAGARTLVGAGEKIYTLEVLPPPETPPPPGTEPPPPNDSPLQLRPIRSWVVAPRILALKADLPSTALDDPPNAPKPPKAVTPPQMPKGSKVAAVGMLGARGAARRRRRVAHPPARRRHRLGRLRARAPRRHPLSRRAAHRERRAAPLPHQRSRRRRGAPDRRLHPRRQDARRLLSRHRRHPRLPLRRPGVRGRARRSRAGLARARRAPSIPRATCWPSTAAPREQQ